MFSEQLELVALVDTSFVVIYLIIFEQLWCLLEALTLISAPSVYVDSHICESKRGKSVNRLCSEKGWWR